VNHHQVMEQYARILQAYLAKKGEDQLYVAQQLSKWLLVQNFSPEEVVDMHVRALEECGELPDFIRETFHILTEVMIEYGNAYRAIGSLRSKQQQMESELEVAAAMQQTLLPRQIPAFPEVEIGLVSVPAKQMSGDYYNFVQHDADTFSVAIADITGKGIPAAMCMSMIKYAMDSYDETKVAPASMLLHLNRVAERNMDPSMFVTMVYGRYNVSSHRFRYAVAGHEPGFCYRSAEDCFYELEGQGAALGVLEEPGFREYEIALEPGDCLILLTDGVTDRKNGRYYIQQEEFLSYLHSGVGSSAQEMADHLYRRLLLLSNFELTDDYTMVVLRRISG
jgi:sigma-B regulation protein RsbU (phosphoserine phosphatase)